MFAFQLIVPIRTNTEITVAITRKNRYGICSSLPSAKPEGVALARRVIVSSYPSIIRIVSSLLVCFYTNLRIDICYGRYGSDAYVLATSRREVARPERTSAPN